MNAGEAFSGLLTIVGSGGLVTAFLGYLAYRREAYKGRGTPSIGAEGMAGIAAGFIIDERFASEIRGALDRHRESLDDHGDVLDRFNDNVGKLLSVAVDIEIHMRRLERMK